MDLETVSSSRLEYRKQREEYRKKRDKISATVIPEPLGPTEGPPVDELFGPLGFAALPSFLFLLSVTIKAEEQIRLKRQSLEQRK